MFFKRGKLFALDTVLSVLDEVLHFPFMLWCGYSAGQGDKSTMQAKSQIIGIQGRFIKVGFQYPGLEVINFDNFGYAAKILKSMFVTANESLDILSPDDFQIGFPAEA